MEKFLVYKYYFQNKIDKKTINKHNIRYLLHMPFKKILLFLNKRNLGVI